MPHFEENGQFLRRSTRMDPFLPKDEVTFCPVFLENNGLTHTVAGQTWHWEMHCALSAVELFYA